MAKEPYPGWPGWPVYSAEQVELLRRLPGSSTNPDQLSGPPLPESQHKLQHKPHLTQEVWNRALQSVITDLQKNGPPQRRDGRRKEYERQVTASLQRMGLEAGKSTVRERVSKAIKAFNRKAKP